MSMMGGGGDPQAALAQMMMSHGGAPQPIGVGQAMGGPTLGAPPAAPTKGAKDPTPPATNGTAQDQILGDMARAAHRGGDEVKLDAAIKKLQKMYPKLKVAARSGGHAELVGPAQEQFLGAAFGRHHDAKVAHVRNRGTGQRLHLEF